VKTIISLVLITVISAALAAASVYIDWVSLPSTGVWVESDLPPQLQPSTKKVHVLEVFVGSSDITARLRANEPGREEACEFPASMPAPTLNEQAFRFYSSVFVNKQLNEREITDDLRWSLIAFYPQPLRPGPIMDTHKPRIVVQQARNLSVISSVAMRFDFDQELRKGFLSRGWLRSDKLVDIQSLRLPQSLVLHTLRFKATPRSLTPYDYDMRIDGRGIVWLPSPTAEPTHLSIDRLDKCDPFRLPILSPAALDELLDTQTEFRSSFLRARIKDTFAWRVGLIFPALVAFRYWRPLLRVGARGARGTSDGLKALDAYDQQVRQ
jgi:hypothetical protein